MEGKPVVRTTTLGRFKIVEVHKERFINGSWTPPNGYLDETEFEVWIDGRDTSHIWATLEEAMIACVAFSRLEANQAAHATRLINRMLAPEVST